MKKKKESIGSFMKRRNKETGMVTIPARKLHMPLAAGSHKLKALQRHRGIVKPKLAKAMEGQEKRKKKILFDEAIG